MKISSPLQEQREVFSSLLRQAPTKELKEFLEESAKSDESFSLRFVIHFIERSGFPDEEKKKIAWRSILALAAGNSTAFSSELRRFIHRAKNFLEEKNFIEAFHSAEAIITDYRELKEEQQSDLHFAMESAFELFSAISGSEAAFDLKEKTFESLQNAARDYSTLYPEEINETCFATLVEISDEPSKLEWTLDCLEEKLESSHSNFRKRNTSYDEPFLLQLKWVVLQKMNRNDEAHELLEANKRDDFFRIKLIEEEISSKNFERAKELIADKKSIENDSYQKLLLKIALEEKDVKSIRALALQLFQSSEFDFQYFDLLKKQYDSAHWKQQVERIVNTVRRNPLKTLAGLNAAAKILIREKAWEKLLVLVQKNANIDFVEAHAEWLKEKFPEELLLIYRTAIRRYAEKFMGDDAYRRVADTLRKMQSIRGGKEIVQSLAIELKVTYHQRRSFVEELNKVVL